MPIPVGYLPLAEKLADLARRRPGDAFGLSGISPRRAAGPNVSWGGSGMVPAIGRPHRAPGRCPCGAGRCSICRGALFVDADGQMPHLSTSDVHFCTVFPKFNSAAAAPKLVLRNRKIGSGVSVASSCERKVDDCHGPAHQIDGWASRVPARSRNRLSYGGCGSCVEQHRRRSRYREQRAEAQGPLRRDCPRQDFLSGQPLSWLAHVPAKWTQVRRQERAPLKGIERRAC